VCGKLGGSEIETSLWVDGVEVEVARWRWKSRNRVTPTRRMACNERRALNLILRKVRHGVGTLRSILGIAVNETVPLTHNQC
jgi:hypothetical protein